ncbi:MAG: PilZ domain-containing protein [Bryobacteraceae bacterium]|nr:PilZ domain-containing protein [Bryobacteraceae bacterium]
MGTISTERERGGNNRRNTAAKDLPEIVAAALPGAAAPTFKGDRRDRERFAVKWPVVLVRRGSVVQSVTENLSSGGFFCYSSQEFVPGEHTQAWIEIPRRGATGKGRSFLLCRARVVRVEQDAARGYGLGCRIEDYNIVTV